MGVCYGTPDFPTPSYAGYLKSGAKWKITPSSSAATTPSPAASNSLDLLAARDKKAFRGGKIVAGSSLTVFSFAELKEATKNFPADALLGKGGVGRVYKGMLHGEQQPGSTETIIAVKLLNPDAAQGHREWMREIASIEKISHPNLAKLLGFCPDDENLALVYEFMPKGSLEYQLFRSGSTASLPWDVRLKIMVGAATGLAFLHNCCRMIHMDFRSANILLDGSYTAKLSDCGLEKSGPQVRVSPISKQVMDTYGYAAPEYIATGHLYLKSNVFSFGVVLLETLTGLRAIDPSRPAGKVDLVKWAKPLLSSKKKVRTIMDSRLKGKYYADSAHQIAQLVSLCLQPEPEQRPSMSEVVEELKSIEAARANGTLRKA
ncbi:probable serine/threonine-protein kinase PIX13 isoform X1 [Eucalyptus grandis]|uniref:probable serine/threonine-protein kinase PIX13 isoform X1 n=1 Tax=Eucalyptus grandis TaxID=71139 RepID=UPI00192F0518|nr:probable serine/threonine-protein kinase PIX13 isoform X1 [Eucalyptus grandis]